MKSKTKIALTLLVIITACAILTTQAMDVKTVTQPLQQLIEQSPLDQKLANTRKMVQYQLDLEQDYIHARDIRNKAQDVFEQVATEYNEGLESLLLYGGGAMDIYSELTTLTE